MTYREQLIAENGADDNVLFLPEEYFDDCLAGFDGDECVFVYYAEKVIQCFIQHQDMDEEMAREWFDYNVAGSRGEGFPTYIYEISQKEV